MNNMFDMNFMGSSATPSSSNLPIQSPFDQFDLPGGYDSSFGTSGASMFAPLTTTTPDTPSTPSTRSQPAVDHSYVTTSCNGVPSRVDYSKHFSADFSSTPEVVKTEEEKKEEEVEEEEDSQDEGGCRDAPILDIVINNVVCSFSTRCHLNLKRIAREGNHVIYKPENGMVSMKLRKPYTTANIWSSGSITATGSNSEIDAKIAARRYCRILQKMGFRVRFGRYRVVNVLGTCSLPFGIRISQFARDHHKQCSYEPELHPGATYTMMEPRATLKLFTTGSITVTAPRVENVKLAINHVWPLVFKYRMEGDNITSRDVKNTQMFVMSGNNTRVSMYNKKRKKAVRVRSRCLNEDSDGENWSDSSGEELEEGEVEMLEDAEEEEY